MISYREEHEEHEGRRDSDGAKEKLAHGEVTRGRKPGACKGVGPVSRFSFLLCFKRRTSVRMLGA
jgi:hypothetical protein